MNMDEEPVIHTPKRKQYCRIQKAAVATRLESLGFAIVTGEGVSGSRHVLGSRADSSRNCVVFLRGVTTR
jgi:hypothetical protein